MSKTKDAGVGHYEVLFIIANKYSEEEAKQLIAKAEEIITKTGSQITFREYWGKKKLAYEINHNAYGYYAYTEFDAEKEAVSSINQAMRLSNEILRHQIVSRKIKSEEDIARDKSIQEKIDAKKEEEQKKLKKKEDKAEAANKAETKKTDKGSKEKGDKTKLKDLDQKLEGILSAKDLI